MSNPGHSRAEEPPSEDVDAAEPATPKLQPSFSYDHEGPSTDRTDADKTMTESTPGATSVPYTEGDYDDDDDDVDPKKKVVSPKKNKTGFGQESPKIVGNAWSFFNRNKIDRQESRYDNDEDEANDAPYSPGEGHEGHVPARQPSVPNGQGLSLFLPSRFSRSGPSTGEGNENDHSRSQKSKKKFPFFRKRNKDKKHSFNALDPDNDIPDEDAAASERASRLVGALALACPSINLLASCLCEDEHGIARAPLLLTLLGFKLTDTSATTFTKNRKFRFDLEYGVGPQRLKWTVEKSAKDVLYLHSKFKIDNLKNEFAKSEEFPKYPIPPLRNRRDPNRKTFTRDLKNAMGPSETSNMGATSRPSIHEQVDDLVSLHSGGTFRGQLAHLREHLSRVSSISTADQSPEQLKRRVQKNQEYIFQVNKYFNDLIQLVSLRPQSNRLFQFFEISPISSLLSYETGFEGKQGVIHIGGTAKSQGWRVGHFKANDLKGMIDRRSEKWLLVRNTYLMYVADINSTLPLEVFLVDPCFKIHYKGDDSPSSTKDADSDSDYDDASLVQKALTDEGTAAASVLNKVFKHLRIVLENSERKIVLVPKSVKEQKLWLKALTDMKNSTPWSEPHRFNSFAPIRDNCYAQWFVDARDYFWAVSSALEMAKDVIFLHDWWLSPELYLRRPANGNQQWRIDRLLQRKAQQGVKIFVIVYRNVGTTVSTDSLYTKHSILSLDEENIHVIRSPNQLLQNTYFWAHHEKLCVIDHTVAFLGGIDLCYGRYDTPDHVLVDDSKVDFESLGPDSLSTEDFVRFQTFPGKDYSNPRVKDFFGLDKPYESMYDRESVPRMPWHDIHMLTSGKVARDLSRHFVQRWNYLLRQKRPSRFTPLLTPPPDLSDDEVRRMGLDGTCEVQLLRSSGNWSLGLKDHEQSIQNAYLKLIETSEHFVYIENQFFVTSCFIDGTEIKNRIGDALVDRIIRAHQEGTNWRAVIVIPLMPGFESQVDEPDGSSVRVIMQCQYMSISRGATSIYAKLRKYGIEPDDYIHFFSLRKWGVIGPNRTLVTEQLYIHAKAMIVDDRAAIIGSANINERSMRGIRDSEVAAIVRDKETISTYMNGEPYLAGKFAHTLRMRLMREHLGVNVDVLDIVERRFKRFEEFARTKQGMQAATSRFKVPENVVMSAMVELASRDILDEPEGTFRWKNFQQDKNLDSLNVKVPFDEDLKEEHELNKPIPLSFTISFNNRTGIHEANKGIRDRKKHSYDARVQQSDNHKQDVFGEGLDKYKTKLAKRARLNSGRFLKDLAHKSMKQNPTGTFLPDVSNVLEFLESDDFEMVDDMDEESEGLVTERNRERWRLLKKISYLQRVAAKEKEQKEEEAVKRARAGFSTNDSSSVSNNKSLEPNGKAPDTNGTVHSHQQSNGDTDAGKFISTTDYAVNNGRSTDLSSETPPLTAAEKRSNSDGPQLEGYSGENVSVVTLNEQSARHVIEAINAGGVQQFNKFIDPYGFEDPMDLEFYEDIWYDNARRNTEIFRLIFHTQPDDTVLSWKDYKQFNKLQRAFAMSQQQESKYRKSKSGTSRDSMTDISESESEDGTEHESNGHVRRNSQITVDMNMYGDNMGLLGSAPPGSNGSSTPPKKGKSPRTPIFSKQDRIPEHDAEASDDRSPSVNEILSEEATDEESIPPNLNGGSVDAEARTDTAEEHASPRRKRGGTFSARKRAALGERIFERESAERILNEIHGHLVFFPAHWLLRELEGGNWFYNTDRIPPIEIYD